MPIPDLPGINPSRIRRTLGGVDDNNMQQMWLPGMEPEFVPPPGSVSGEGLIGRYGILQRKRFIDIEAHHMPSANYMGQLGIPRSRGLAMNMHVSRHARTQTYRISPPDWYLELTPRQALASDILDMRKIYRIDNCIS